MDWSRAKNILIIALIIANTILAGVYVKEEANRAAEVKANTQAAIEYVEKQGIEINCAVPEKIQSVTVIHLRIKDSLPGGLARTEYDDIPVEILGLRSANNIDAIQKTDIEIEVLPAYTAILKSLDSVENEIDDVELIYLVDRSSLAGAGEDTALPYWKISSGSNSFYYSAFSE